MLFLKRKSSKDISSLSKLPYSLCKIAIIKFSNICFFVTGFTIHSSYISDYRNHITIITVLLITLPTFICLPRAAEQGKNTNANMTVNQVMASECWSTDKCVSVIALRQSKVQRIMSWFKQQRNMNIRENGKDSNKEDKCQMKMRQK